MASSFRFSSLILGFAFLLQLLLLLLQIPYSYSLTCTSQKFTNNRLFQHCNDLPKLSSYLHWTYNTSKSSLNLAFVASPTKPNGWIAWAINPSSTGMLGAQALIAFKQENGSMTVGTFNVSSYKKIEPSKISLDVKEMEAEYVDGVMRLYATVVLPEKLGTVVNQVWQVGGSVKNGVPNVHEFKADNLNSKGTLDLIMGQGSSSNSAVGSSAADSKLRNRNIHGILNAVSWGILFPLGVIISRYLKTFKSADPAWFYLHVSCQFSAYIIGVAGWGTGLKLGSQSKNIQYTTHRNIGIALFCLATLQIFALFLRPKKDHKYRVYWNFYHHGVGYVIVILGIINVFKGLGMLNPAHKWSSAYVVMLSVLGGLALLLETITWIIVLKKPEKIDQTL